MWWALGVSAALVAFVGGALALISYFGRNAREIERKLGEARGEIDSLRRQLDEARRELEAMQVALARALERAPTLDELERMSREAAGGGAPAGAAAAIKLP